MNRVKAWYRVCDFLNDEKIEFKESVNGVYLPYFEPYVKRINNKNITVDKLEQRYMDTWRQYCEYMREYFKEEKNVKGKLF